MQISVFTPFSVGIGSVAGALVGAAFWLAGAPWVLAILNGLVTGATVLTVRPLSRLKRSRAQVLRSGHGIIPVGYMVVLAPAILVRHGLADLDSVAVFALGMLLLVTGAAGWGYGFLMATLEQRDSSDQVGTAPASTPSRPAAAAE